MALASGLDAALELKREHGLCQLALVVRGHGVVLMVPVEIVEIDLLRPQQTAQQKMAHVIDAELALKPVDRELLFGHLCDGSVAYERGNRISRSFQRPLEQLRRSLAHRRQVPEVHQDEGKP